MKRHFPIGAMTLASAMLAMPAAQAAEYPSQPLKLLVGYAPGGSVDTFARIVAPKLGAELGQTVVIENMPGAGGMIAVSRAVKAKPDGYTILMGIVSDVVIAPLVQSAATYTYQTWPRWRRWVPAASVWWPIRNSASARSAT